MAILTSRIEVFPFLLFLVSSSTASRELCGITFNWTILQSHYVTAFFFSFFHHSPKIRGFIWIQTVFKYSKKINYFPCFSWKVTFYILQWYSDNWFVLNSRNMLMVWRSRMGWIFIWMDLFVLFYTRFWIVGGRGGGYINRILYEFLTISERKCVSLFFSRLSEISVDKILKVIHSYHPTSQWRTGVDYCEPRTCGDETINW